MRNITGGSGRRTPGRRAAVAKEDEWRETEKLEVKLLRDRALLSARGTLPHREVPRS